MNDPALAIRDYLVTLGYVAGGTSIAPFSVFVGQPPDTPDALILINATGGPAPENRLLLNYPSVQVVVRGSRSGYIAASNKIREVTNKLVGAVPGNLSGDFYRGCTQLSDIAYLGQDDNTRPMFSANFRFYVEPAEVTGGHRVPIN